MKRNDPTYYVALVPWLMPNAMGMAQTHKIDPVVLRSIGNRSSRDHRSRWHLPDHPELRRLGAREDLTDSADIVARALDIDGNEIVPVLLRQPMDESNIHYLRIHLPADE
ncbi:MAG: hypothetical protein L7T84_03325 [Akkermansiaceae bacterium]|nr:hypothetical protein [Akkermansiaceae bacterium]